MRCFFKVNPTAGAFKGWHVLLCVGSSVKQHGFKRMLEAGSGTVGSTHPPFNNLERVTHAFVGMLTLFFIEVTSAKVLERND